MAVDMWPVFPYIDDEGVTTKIAPRSQQWHIVGGRWVETKCQFSSCTKKKSDGKTGDCIDKETRLACTNLRIIGPRNGR